MTNDTAKLTDEERIRTITKYKCLVAYHEGRTAYHESAIDYHEGRIPYHRRYITDCQDKIAELSHHE